MAESAANKAPILRVTHDDCEFAFTRSSGKGGQNVNKRDTKARCWHRPSGAVGQAQDHREQYRNKVLAFQRMAATPEFRAWARLEVAKRNGTLLAIEEAVERAMCPENLQLEVKSPEGTWKSVPLDAPLDRDE